MCRHFHLLIALSLGVLLALVAAVCSPTWTSRALSFVILVALSPLWLYFYAGLRKWFATHDLFSPLVAFPFAYVAWFAIGSIDFVELPHSISFGAFDPIPFAVCIYAAIGLVGYFLAANIAMSDHAAPVVRKVPHFRNVWGRRATSFLAGLGVVVLGLFLYIALHIGMPILQSDAAAARMEVGNYHLAGSLLSIAEYMFFPLALALLWTRPERSRSTKTLAFVLWSIAAMVILLSAASRSAFFIVILTVIVAYNYLKKPLRLGRVLLALVAIFAFLSLYGYVRDLTVESNLDKLLAEAGIPLAVQPFLYCYLYIRYPVATFRDIVEIIPNQVSYQHGAITLMPFMSLLPGHHEMSDMYFKQLLGNEFLGGGQPATLVAPFYADGGPIGIFVAMFGWGIVVSKLYQRMLNDGTVGSVMIYAWAVQAGISGIFGGIFGNLGTLLVPVGWAGLDWLMRPTRIARVVSDRREL